MLVVILAGLLLGGALAHFFGGPKGAPSAAPSAFAALSSPSTTSTPIVATPLPTPTPVATVTATSRPAKTPASRILASKTPRPERSAPVAPPTRRVSSTPVPAPSKVRATPTSSPTAKAIAAVPLPAASPAALSGEDRATSLVRSYLDALARGDRATAASYLARGSPSETFMSRNAHIESIRSASLGAQQYKVTADVQTVGGEYYVTFTVQSGPGGLQITDHYSIKPQ